MEAVQRAGTVFCPRCGTQAAAGQKFCNNCGNALPAQGGIPRAAPARRIARGKPGGLSLWWIVIPTLFFAFLDRSPVRIGAVAAIGAGLWFGKDRAELPIPAGIRGFLPLVQLFVVFIFLGGSSVTVGIFAALVIAAVYYRNRLIPLLEPWWKLQASIPRGARLVAAVVLGLLIGNYYGNRAGGNEWTVTFISIAVATIATVFLLFTPPDAWRRPSGGR